MVFTISKGIILQVQMEFQKRGIWSLCQFVVQCWQYSNYSIKKLKHILISKLNACYSQKEIRKQVSHPVV